MKTTRSSANLLFLLATWHAYAKLRLHTESTLEKQEAIGTSLCQALRKFTNVTCPRYTTKELPREANARMACQQTQATQGGRRADQLAAQSSRNGSICALTRYTASLTILLLFDGMEQQIRTIRRL